MIGQSDSLLAIDPTTRGFGYAAIRGDGVLLASAAPDTRKRGNAEVVRRVSLLFSRFKPALFVIEDVRSAGSRRSARVRDLLSDLEREAISRGMTVRKLSPASVRRRLVGSRHASKVEIGAEVVKYFSRLEGRKPRKRRAGHPEPRVVGMFDAVALGLTVLLEDRNIPRKEAA